MHKDNFRNMEIDTRTGTADRAIRAASNLWLRVVTGVRLSVAGNDCASKALIRHAC